MLIVCSLLTSYFHLLHSNLLRPHYSFSIHSYHSKCFYFDVTLKCLSIFLSFLSLLLCFCSSVVFSTTPNSHYLLVVSLSSLFHSLSLMCPFDSWQLSHLLDLSLLNVVLFPRLLLLFLFNSLT